MGASWTQDFAGTVDIDRTGDVLLLIGPSEESHVSLLVSSKVPSLASPVFEVMFGPHFKEGNALREDK